MGAYYLQPQTHVPYFYIMIYYVMARARLLGHHNILGGGGGGGTNGKDPKIYLFNRRAIIFGKNNIIRNILRADHYRSDKQNIIIIR